MFASSPVSPSRDSTPYSHPLLTPLMISYNEGLRVQLRRAVIELNSRGLYQAAKWTSEQLQGMVQSHSSEFIPQTHRVEIDPAEIDLIQFSQALLASAEFQRCAHLFRTPIGLKSSLSPLSIFIACYSLYMAGERLKDQADAENPLSLSNSLNLPVDNDWTNTSTTKSISSVRNPYLSEIFSDLLPLYEEYNSALFLEPQSSPKMDGFLLYLFAVIVRDLRAKDVNYHIPDHRKLMELPSTEEIFMQSISEYPFNWYYQFLIPLSTISPIRSCWLDFSKYCIDENCPLPSRLQQIYDDVTSGRVSLSQASDNSADDVSNSPFTALIMKMCFFHHHFVQVLKPHDSLQVI